MKKKKYKPQDRAGLDIGDRVKASFKSGYARYGTGTVLEFLDDPNALNNGAALVQFNYHPSTGVVEGQGIRPYVDTAELTVVMTKNDIHNFCEELADVMFGLEEDDVEPVSLRAAAESLAEKAAQLMRSAGEPAGFAFTVPTYYGDADGAADKQEYDTPNVPVLVHESAGLKLVLGGTETKDSDKPDIQIERRPGGWAIFLTPVGGDDHAGYVYFLDSGEACLVKAHEYAGHEAIKVAKRAPAALDKPTA